MHHLRSLVVLAAISLSAIVVTRADAQQWNNVNQLDPGTEIRVTLATGAIVRGFVQFVTAESLAINATTSQETLARRDIRQVAVRKPGHRGRNTLIGLGIGTGVGLALGAGVDSKSGPGNWLPDAGKIVFTPVGAIVGTVIGVALPTGGWRNVYRAQ